MIVDITGHDWIIRFKGKKISFQVHRTFTKWIEKISHSGEAFIQIDLSNIQKIDNSAMSLFLKFFQTLNPKDQQVQILNASQEIQQKLNDLLSIVDSMHHLNNIEDSNQAHAKQLFAKVLSARTMQIQQEESRDQILTQTTTAEELEPLTKKKDRMVTYLKHTQMVKSSKQKG